MDNGDMIRAACKAQVQRNNPMKYVCFDYEEPGVDNYWHIYTFDEHDALMGMATLLCLKGPDTPEMFEAVKKIAGAIDAAVTMVESYK